MVACVHSQCKADTSSGRTCRRLSAALQTQLCKSNKLGGCMFCKPKVCNFSFFALPNYISTLAAHSHKPCIESTFFADLTFPHQADNPRTLLNRARSLLQVSAIGLFETLMAGASCRKRSIGTLSAAIDNARGVLFQHTCCNKLDCLSSLFSSISGLGLC